MNMEVNVITGGGSGIGFAAAESLPTEQIVLITGRNEEKLSLAAGRLSEKGFKVHTKTCDVSVRSDVEQLASFAKSLGTVRSVIHAAGVSASQSDLEGVIRINALGVVYVTQTFMPVMKGDGCIAIIGSCSSAVLPRMMLPVRAYPLALKNEKKFVRACLHHSKIVPNEFRQKSLAYCITKNFVRWYVLHESFQYAIQNKRLVCISPGIADTALGQAELKTKETQAMLRYTGFARPAKPKEIGFLAATVVDERNSYLTGAEIVCDGGCTAAGFGMWAALEAVPAPKLPSD